MPKQILLIEDDPDQIVMYQTKFELEGLELLAAEKAQEGINLAKKEKPGLILLDLLLKELTAPTGLEILKKLKADPETKNIPVLVLTNYGTREAKEESLRLGAADFIIKAQITPAKLVEKVKKILKNK